MEVVQDGMVVALLGNIYIIEIQSEWCIHDIYNRAFTQSIQSIHRIHILLTLGKGDLVGCDIPLLQTPTGNTTDVVKSSADVRALTYCFLECIHVPGLLQVLKLHTDFRAQFATDIQHDLTYNLRQGFEQDEEEGMLRSRLPSISEHSDVGTVASDVFGKPSPSASNNNIANASNNPSAQESVQISTLRTEVWRIS